MGGGEGNADTPKDGQIDYDELGGREIEVKGGGGHCVQLSVCACVCVHACVCLCLHD